jgi:hypothetical protein
MTAAATATTATVEAATSTAHEIRVSFAKTPLKY